MPRFLRDFICVGPILLWAIYFGSGCWGNIRGFLSATSMGVFIWHPLFAVIFQRMLSKVFEPSYTAGVVLFAWAGSYVSALITTVLVSRTPLRRFQV